MSFFPIRGNDKQSKHDQANRSDQRNRANSQTRQHGLQVDLVARAGQIDLLRNGAQ
jgi:hypothetical protein